MSNIMKELHKDVTYGELNKSWLGHSWLGNNLPYYAYAVIRHMETKFDLMQKEIDQLKEEQLKKEQPLELKVGWVYEYASSGASYLVLKKEGEYFYTVRLGSNKHDSYELYKWESPHFLSLFNLETGKKWEVEE